MSIPTWDICMCCADRDMAAAQKIIATNGIRSLVGKVVHVRFVSVNGRTVEHMQVRVLGRLRKAGAFEGILLNVPVHEHRPRLVQLQRVFFNATDIAGIDV
jgi:hypothetical protein